MPRNSLGYLSCLVLSEFSGSVVSCMSLFLENSQPLVLQTFLLLLSLFFFLGFPSYTLSVSSPLLGYSVPCLFHSFPLGIAGWADFIDLTSSSLIVFLAMSTLLMSPSKAFFISVTVFNLFLSFFLILRVSTSLLLLPFHSLHVVHFFH